MQCFSHLSKSESESESESGSGSGSGSGRSTLGASPQKVRALLTHPQRQCNHVIAADLGARGWRRRRG